MTDREAEKRVAARHAVRFVQDGMRVGLGSGSTAAYAIRYLGERICKEGLRVVGVPTSAASRALANEVNVPIAGDLEGFELDVAIDGADEATRVGDLMKGGGGAMFHERIVASAARRFIVICDSSKLVENLGQFPLPVEVCSFGWRNVANRLRTLGCEPKLRAKDGQPFLTAEGNFIIDCQFTPASLQGLRDLDQHIATIPGVVDHGLFLGMADVLVIARGEVVEEICTRTA